MYIAQELIKPGKISTNKRACATAYDQIDKPTKSEYTIGKFLGPIVTLVTMAKEKGVGRRDDSSALLGCDVRIDLGAPGKKGPSYIHVIFVVKTTWVCSSTYNAIR